MKRIELTNGYCALVDDSDHAWLMQWKWRALVKKLKNHGRLKIYAIRDEDKKIIYMHKQIANTPEGLQTDHADRNTLNNQRYNLRNCTDAENRKNKTPYGKSKYMGVRINKKKDGRTYIYCEVNGKYVGTFKTEEAAAMEYDRLAVDLWGKFAYLNFPNEVNKPEPVKQLELTF